MKKKMFIMLVALALIIQMLNFRGKSYSLAESMEDTYTPEVQSLAISNESYKELWFDDFEEGSLGDGLNPEDYTSTLISDSYVKITDEEFVSGTKSVKLEKNAGSGLIALTKSFTPVSDIFLEINIFTTHLVNIELISNSITVANLCIRSDLKLYNRYNKVYQSISDNVLDNWNNIRIESDTFSGVYRVYLNGVLLKDDVPMIKGNLINAISIKSGSEPNYAIYIDDISIGRKLSTPGGFALQYPENQAQVSTSGTFTWEGSEDAKEYRIIVDDNIDFVTPVFSAVVDETFAEVGGLESDKGYFWKVIAINTIGETPCNEIFSFTTFNPIKPGEFSLLAPENNSLITGIRPTLVWNPSSNTSKYIVIVDDDSDFSSPFIREEVRNSTFKEFGEIEGLDYDKEYFWKVIAINDGVEEVTESSEPYRFKTPLRYGVEQISVTDFFGNIISGTKYPEYIRINTMVTCNTDDNEPVNIAFELCSPEGLVERVYVEKQMGLGEAEIVKVDFSLPSNMEGYTIKALIYKDHAEGNILSNIVRIIGN